MKKYIIPLVGLVVLPLSAQNVVDATRFGSQNITGTARYRAMGGAFGALGGDPSCMTDNPAGMGIYRGTSSISFTPNLSFAHATTEGSETSKQKKVDCSVSNLAYILSIKTPGADNLVNFNIGVGFNHSEGLSRKYKMVIDNPTSSFGNYLANRSNNVLISQGYYNDPGYLFDVEKDAKGNITYDPWSNNDLPLTTVAGYDCYATDKNGDATNGYNGLISRDEANQWASYHRLFVTEQNRNDEYNLNFSGNWNDFIYGGITLTISDFNSTIETEFDEDYDYNYQGDFTQAFNDLETKGTGFGVKAGILIKPTDTWRIGFAAHTPTWYHMEDLYNIRMMSSDANCSGYSESGTFSYKYKYYTPWQMQLSSAWVIGSKALVSVEADMKDYSTQKYRADNDSWNTDELNYMDDYFDAYNKLQMTYKVGAEYRVTDWFSVRAGYAFKSSPYKDKLYDNPEASRGWYANDGSSWGDENSIIFDSSTKPNYSLLGNQQFFSIGCGWSGDWWSIDLTCMDRHMQEKIAAFPTTDAVDCDSQGFFTTTDASIGAVQASHCDMKTDVLSWDLTIGLRF